MQQFDEVIVIIGVYIDDSKLVRITEPKTIHFNLTKKVDNSLKYEIDSIIKPMNFLLRITWKTRLVNYCQSISMKAIYLNIQNSKKVNYRNLFLICHKK